MDHTHQSSHSQSNNKALKSIYASLDVHQYSRAYKLTLSKPQCDWPLTIALRAHALERCGRMMESLLTVKKLLGMLSFVWLDTEGSGGSVEWGELEEMIWMLRISGASSDGSGNAEEGSGGDGSSSIASSSSSKGKGKKNKKGGGAQKEVQQQQGSDGISNTANTLKLDLVDILDIPKWKRREILGSASSITAMHDSKITLALADQIVEETTIATIAVTLKVLRLNQTLAQMHSLSCDILTDKYAKAKVKSKSSKKGAERELCDMLIQSYLSQLRVVTDYPKYSSESSSPTTVNSLSKVSSSSSSLESSSPTGTPKMHVTEGMIHETKTVLQCYESAQLTAMSLARHFSASATTAANGGSTLYTSWCAHAALEHLKSCRELLHLLQIYRSQLTTKTLAEKDEDRSEEYAALEKKIQMKVGMLPRLAESLMSRVVKSTTATTTAPSADDWSLYLSCLGVQDKYTEAVQVLETIRCVVTPTDSDTANTTSNNGDTKKEKESDGGDVVKDKEDGVGEGFARRINDEFDVQNHLGSLMQLSERERLERMVETFKKLGKMDEAATFYSDRLLTMMPDQWSYWMGLLECSVACATTEGEGIKRCEEVVTRFLDGSSDHRKSLRGPNLFQVEMAAWKYRMNDSGDAAAGLSQAILKYGNIFSPLASCCFQDLRTYISLLVQKSCSNGSITGEVINVLGWTKTLRESNDPSSVKKPEEEDEQEKKERRKKLRAYITSVQITFEIWIQLITQCNGSTTNEITVDKAMADYVPGADEMVHLWENTMNLKSNPKDGGQKEFLPGDELILLTCQLLIHESRFLGDAQRKASSLLVATLLEHATLQSPFNPYLKIAALNTYMTVNAPSRAWDMFQDMGVKYIQLDSCSYFILSKLGQGGFYKEAITHSGHILSLHSSSAKDIGDYSAKSFENGNLIKGQEMMDWQRSKMRQSLQLFQAKVLIMDYATLLYSGGEDTNVKLPPPLGAFHGICGGDTDGTRAEKIVRDSDNAFAAPSILNLVASSSSSSCTSTSTDDVPSPASAGWWSDNRDLSVNQFEILVRSDHHLSMGDDWCREAIFRAHVHGVLTRLVLLVQVTKSPKKGKIVKHVPGESLDRRSKSLLRAIDVGSEYVEHHFGMSMMEGHRALWEASLSLARTVCIVSTGRGDSGGTVSKSDTVSSREEACLPHLSCASKKIDEARKAFALRTEEEKVEEEEIGRVCELLADYIVTLFALIETAGNLFGSFGWGKRKRRTKAGSAALAEVCLSLRSLVSDMKSVVELLPPLSTEPISLEESNKKAAADADADADDDNINEAGASVISVRKGPIIEACIGNLEGSGSRLKETYLQGEKGKEMLDLVAKHVISSQQCTRDRVEPFLIQMLDTLETYNVEE